MAVPLVCDCNWFSLNEFDVWLFPYQKYLLDSNIYFFFFCSLFLSLSKIVSLVSNCQVNNEHKRKTQIECNVMSKWCLLCANACVCCVQTLYWCMHGACIRVFGGHTQKQLPFVVPMVNECTGGLVYGLRHAYVCEWRHIHTQTIHIQFCV